MKLDTSQLRVATLSHGHPSLSAGGAEIAAKTLHQCLADLPGITAMHLACVPANHPLAAKAPAGNDRFIATARLNAMTLARTDPTEHAALLDLLDSFQPQVIHLHHILGFGADALFALRSRFPAAAILLTLHEFIAICHNQGQMARPDGTLCERATPTDCSQCFPDRTPAQFLIRAQALRAMLSLIDGIIAPSAFLAARYRAWGIPASSIIIIENAVEAGQLPTRPTGRPPQRRGHFAFFGQITPYKGVDVLLEAVSSMADASWQGCTLDIHGSNLDRQPEAFQARIHALLASAGARVNWRGAYRNADLPALMAECDWVVVPSTWWENSPIVIQEAFRSGRPVIASAIGGMAEKVLHGRNGLTFEVGNASDLAQCLTKASDPAVWIKLQAGIVPPVAPSIIAEWHLRLYRHLLERRSALQLA